MSLIYWLLFIFSVSVLIFVHELGHLLIAKWARVDVQEFSVGFGNELWSLSIGSTKYSLRALPIGGFVNIEQKSFTAARAIKRIMILLGGVIFNFLFSVIAFIIFFSFTGNTTLVVNPANSQFIGSSGIYTPVVISESQNESLPQGSLLVGIDDSFFNSDFGPQDAIQGLTAGEQINLHIYTESSLKQVSARLNDEAKLGIAFFVPEPAAQIIQYDDWHAAISHSLNLLNYQVETLIYLLNPFQEGSNEAGDGLSSIVGAGAAFESVATNQTLIDALNVILLINISLIIMNMLPLPALDGGQIVIILLESITGKKIPEEKLNLINNLFFFLLIGFSVFLIFRDLFQFQLVNRFAEFIELTLGR